MTPVAATSAPSAACGGCGTEIAAGLLACPACHRLVHASVLKELQRAAGDAARAGDTAAEIAAWRSALALLPEGSKQHVAISERLASLSQNIGVLPQGRDAPPSTGVWKWLGGLGTAGLLLWKFKFLLVALATKGKLLLLGLTKASTFFSMLLAFGVYWAAWGMWFAGGLVLSIYVHEMGHVAALRRYGIEATAPMFVPGLGAFIRMRARKLAAHEDARIGLAGPWWGLGAAAAALVVWWSGGGPIWAALARTGAWINLFNLMPVWQLDGNRGFAALARAQRWSVVLAFAVAWSVTGDGLLVLLILAAVVRAFDRGAPEHPDRGALLQFVALVLALAAVFAATSGFHFTVQ